MEKVLILLPLNAPFEKICVFFSSLLSIMKLIISSDSFKFRKHVIPSIACGSTLIFLLKISPEVVVGISFLAYVPNVA